MSKKYFNSFGFSILAILFLAGTVSAVPGFPLHFYGDVTINGASAPDGVVVDARVSDDIVAITTTSGGTYGEGSDVFYVPDPMGTMHGKTVEFYVQDIKAAEYTFNIMDNPVDLGLAVSIPNFCGDGKCESGESCSSCSDDCGACTPPPGGGDPGGGGVFVPSGDDDDEGEDETGDAGETACVEDWLCTEWTECVTGKQSRSCADINRCGTEENRPEEMKSCLISATCEAGETTCLDNVLSVCTSDGISWMELEKCEFGCSEGKCLNNPFSFTGFITGSGTAGLADAVLALLVIAVIAGLYFIKFRGKGKF